MLYTKSEAAFLLSCETLYDRNPSLYFWTFTAEWPESDTRFAAAFHLFWRRVQRHWNSALFEGIRVFEPHQGGAARDGFLHCHALVNERLPIALLKRLAVGTGIGIMWVRKCCASDPSYMAKYLSKDFGAKGVRKWAYFGYACVTRKNDIEVISSEANEFREVYKTYKGEPQAFVKTRLHVGMRRANEASCDTSIAREVRAMSLCNAICAGKRKNTDFTDWEHDPR